ncbi:MAG: 16S rRNA (guanine(527)-N(7))-methyltransferase RsmG [Legionellaceae bacterium]|nr:16S rRNA (guanine(527)-N(7))-methyltransferase RsmG [Legionellaceae bacterium]HAF87567.1 16S rRNA (guanine(527)-N(7))-methyltransferase RsmG [Legionellales bacterium]|tara:strand:- start:4371 stop:4979 length:609 start_codon:yes stop_codon:yes gene_type:complete
MMALETLEQGLAQLGLFLDPKPFMHYLALLEKWNKAYNLTAIRHLDDMVVLHVLDSLAILAWVCGTSLLDVGSGAGLPGLPIALARPEIAVTLLDGNGKKCRFLQEVKRQLKLPNLNIVHTRMEHFKPVKLYDCITSRAFSHIEPMMRLTRTVLAPNGAWLAMKGVPPLEELANIAPEHYKLHTYQVPFLDGQRCCVVMDNH